MTRPLPKPIKNESLVGAWIYAFPESCPEILVHNEKWEQLI
jgi:hypothetical protein